MPDNQTTEASFPESLRAALVRLSDEELERLKHELVGTCQEIDAALVNLALDVAPEVAEDQLLDGSPSVERCVGCEWWFESNALEADGAGDALCEQCWPEGHDA